MRRKRLLVPHGPRRRGAPPGNANAFKHGKFTRERLTLYADIRAFIAQGRALVTEAKAGAQRSDPEIHPTAQGGAANAGPLVRRISNPCNGLI